MILSEKMEQCLWIAHKLFERNRTSGTTGNISFLHEDCMYITASGTCFGTLNANQLCRISMVDGMLKTIANRSFGREKTECNQVLCKD